MKAKQQVYVKELNFPFEGNRWAAVLVNDSTGYPFATYGTKEEAVEDMNDCGFHICLQ